MRLVRIYCWALMALSAAAAGALVWLCLDRPHAWPLVLLPVIVGIVSGRIIKVINEV